MGLGVACQAPPIGVLGCRPVVQPAGRLPVALPDSDCRGEEGNKDQDQCPLHVAIRPADPAHPPSRAPVPPRRPQDGMRIGQVIIPLHILFMCHRPTGTSVFPCAVSRSACRVPGPPCTLPGRGDAPARHRRRTSCAAEAAILPGTRSCGAGRSGRSGLFRGSLGDLPGLRPSHQASQFILSIRGLCSAHLLIDHRVVGATLGVCVEHAQHLGEVGLGHL